MDLKRFTEATSTDMDAFFAEMMQDSSYSKLAKSEKRLKALSIESKQAKLWR